LLVPVRRCTPLSSSPPQGGRGFPALLSSEVSSSLAVIPGLVPGIHAFNDADTVVVTEVYPAGEAPIAGIDRDSFVLGLRAHGHREVVPLQDSAALAGVITGLAKPGDYVVCLGAGNITQWAYALPGELKALG
jgi:hypothetical protein